LRPAWSRGDMQPRSEHISSQTEATKRQPVQLLRIARPSSMGDDSKASPTRQIVPEEFFIDIREALVDAMGPMAHIVLSEHVKLLGESFDHFERNKIELLIDSVSREIFDQSIRSHFRQNMSAKLRAI